MSDLAGNKQERFHFLDGLRGIAALMIFFHHAFTANIVHFLDRLGMPGTGYYFQHFTQSGVDLFFVLSGVVLLRPYIRRQRQFHVIDYFKRRAKRIYPPYFFALLFAAFVVWENNAFPTWYNVSGMRTQFSWLETFKEAFIVNRDGVYYNLAWWSLGIEVMFYLIAPLVLFVFPRRHNISDAKMAVAIMATVALATWLQFFCTDHFNAVYSLTYDVANVSKFVEYPLCFLMGVFLAAKDFNIKHGICFILFGLVLLGCGWYHVSYMEQEPHYYPILHSGYALIYAGVIALAFNAQSFKAFLSRPLMIWLGERSYSLFLIHFSVFYLTDNVVSHFIDGRNVYYGIWTRLIGIPLAFFAALLLFWFVEKKQARGLVTANAFWPWQMR